MSFVSQADLQALLNVTADSLAEYCGLTGDRQENTLALERQVRISTSPSSPFLIFTLACFTPKESITRCD